MFCIFIQYVYNYVAFIFLRDSNVLQDFARGKSFPPPFWWQSRQGSGTARDLTPYYSLQWLLTHWAGRVMVHRTITKQVHLYSTPESAHARGQIKWDLGINSPHSASLLHTLGQHGFPDSQLQCQTPWWGGVKGPNLPWPVLSLKGLTVNGHQNAKILAKSAVSVWEAKFSPKVWRHSEPSFQSSQYLEGKGARTHTALQLWPHQGF